MARTVSFTVPGPPKPWKRPTEFIDKAGNRRRVTDPKDRAARKVVSTLARLAWRGPPVEGPVALKIIGVFPIPAYWPDRLKLAAREGRVLHTIDPDLDQLIKLVKDSLSGLVYVDDNQVAAYPGSCKRYGTPARTEITIQVLDQQDDEITPAQRRTLKRAQDRGLMPKPAQHAQKHPLLFPSKTISSTRPKRSKP